MKLSKLFTKTNKDNISDEVSVNAQLLLRWWYTYKEMAGVYAFLPLGLRVLNKIENIIRKHIDRIWSEILMPSLAPTERRQNTGRLDQVDVLMKTTWANELSKTKSSNEYILNSTHEELVTPIIKHFVKSYKDLPLAVYQIQTKFRNEARAKSWLLRGREFRMKDLYSFHTSKEDLIQYYDFCKIVYKNIFDELGIGQDTYITLASGGDFTDEFSHEFQTICDAGEDTLFIDGNLCYNEEVCPSRAPEMPAEAALLPKEDIFWLDVIWVEDLAKFLNVKPEQTTKTMLFVDENEKYYAVAIRWDYEINTIKLKKVLWCKKIDLISEEKIKELTGADRWYAGLVNLPEIFTIICDDSIQNRMNFECGTNKTGYHTINVNRERDIATPEHFYDIKMVKKWDMNPETGNARQVKNGCEVGNIFPLEIKFTKALDFYFTDANNQKNLVYMWCYGIWPSRLMWVIVEKSFDEKWIIRPENIAPFRYIILPIWAKNLELANKFYDSIYEKWIEACMDDRWLNPGAMFADADLLGIPYQIVISDKTLARGDNMVELINRKTWSKDIVNFYDILK